MKNARLVRVAKHTLMMWAVSSHAVIFSFGLLWTEESVACLSTEAPSNLFKEGQAEETKGNIKAAVRYYLRAVRSGQFDAAKALGDIFATGKGEVTKDVGESQKYYAIAEMHGVKIDRSGPQKSSANRVPDKTKVGVAAGSKIEDSGNPVASATQATPVRKGCSG